MSICARLMAIILGMSLGMNILGADENAQDATPQSVPPLDPGMDMSQVIALLQQQQQELAEQRKLLQKQAMQIQGLKGELDVLRAPTPPVSGNEEVAAVAEAGPDAGEQAAEPIAMAAIDAQPEPAGEKQAPTVAQQQQQAGNSVATAQADDPTKALLSDFVGAWRLPGTDAALRIGGFVKTDIVYNFDPLEISDRFIVGSIPVGQSNASSSEAESSITANQSRLNFDLREPTKVGVLRAFIEGDFAGGGNGNDSGDNFRLRHAFGQWNRVLAGKTWSAFMDTEASPEEVDFEGLNGRINVRQAQVRLMPERGAEYGLIFSLEDPNPEVQDGEGVTRAPDVVLAGRFNPNDRLHLRVALIGRQIRAEADPGFGEGVSKQYAWGTSVSGRFRTPYFDKRDSLMFQLNNGDGIGRYVNDLSSVGNYDGIFDPDTGNLQLFEVLAGYVSWQHWWSGPRSLRSNFTAGFVDVNNPGFIAPNAYKRTFRLSTNLFWTPTPRIDMGTEYLWGRRENENGEEGDASQIQLMARYRF
jgi:hypothetical protein